MDNFLFNIKTLFRTLEQLTEKIPVGSQIYPQIATIVATNDPANKGRVKVTYDNAPNEVSEWVEVAGYHSGNLPSMYIGSRMVAVFLNGLAEDAVLLGTLQTDLDLGVMSQPVTVPGYDEQLSGSVPECSASNEGNLMIFSNTISSDLKVCIRRNSVTANKDNPQKLESIYSWKSLTNSLEILKGEYGTEVPDVSIKKGIRECSAELEGETRLFTEDRMLRQVLITCRKMPGGKYAWINANSPAVYVRSLLPPCTEESHGAEVVVDDGYNSELVVCLRRKKEMKWMSATMKELSFFPDPIPPDAELPEVVKNEEAPTPEKYISDKNPLSQISFSSGSVDTDKIQKIISQFSSLLNL